MRSNRKWTGRLTTLAVCVALVGVAIAAATANDGSVESLDSRRSRLENMSPAERDRLMRNQERFQQLSENERQQLRQLHSALEQDLQSDQLKQVMQRYQDWLKTLPTIQRAELQQLSAEKRVDRIKELLAEEHRERNRRLAIPDVRVYQEWIEKRVLASLPDSERKSIEEIANERDRRAMIRSHVEERMRGRTRSRSPSADEIEDLKKRLRPTAQQALTGAQAAGRDELRKLLYSWMLQTRRGPEDVRMPTKEQLTKYFDTLSERDRDEYLALPPDEMWQRLTRNYFRAQFSKRNSARPPGTPQGNPRSDRRDGNNRPGGRDRLPDRSSAPAAKGVRPGNQ